MWVSYTGECYYKDIQRHITASDQFCKICKRWRIKEKASIGKEENPVVFSVRDALPVSRDKDHLWCWERMVLHNWHALCTAIWIYKGNCQTGRKTISAITVFSLEYRAAAAVRTSFDESFYNNFVHWDRRNRFCHWVLAESEAYSIPQSETDRSWKVCRGNKSKNYCSPVSD